MHEVSYVMDDDANPQWRVFSTPLKASQRYTHCNDHRQGGRQDNPSSSNTAGFLVLTVVCGLAQVSWLQPLKIRLPYDIEHQKNPPNVAETPDQTRQGFMPAHGAMLASIPTTTLMIRGPACRPWPATSTTTAKAGLGLPLTFWP
jgi:hypothetical protein